MNIHFYFANASFQRPPEEVISIGSNVHLPTAMWPTAFHLATRPTSRNSLYYFSSSGFCDQRTLKTIGLAVKPFQTTLPDLTYISGDLF